MSPGVEKLDWVIMLPLLVVFCPSMLSVIVPSPLFLRAMMLTGEFTSAVKFADEPLSRSVIWDVSGRTVKLADVLPALKISLPVFIAVYQ